MRRASKTPEKVSSGQGVDEGKIGNQNDEGKWRNQGIQVNTLIVGSSWIEGRNNPTAHQEVEIDGQKRTHSRSDGDGTTKGHSQTMLGLTGQSWLTQQEKRTT